MIAFLEGKLVEKHPTEVVLEVGGIGYQVFIPASSFERLPEPGQPVRLFTYLYVREDALHLYGFINQEERTLFETMIQVSGIGPRLALAALSAMQPAELRDSIVSGDTALLTRIPGIGRKTAERMIVELRDRLSQLEFARTAPLAGTTPEQAAARADALAALESLGLSRAVAEKRIRQVLRRHPHITSAEELIRLALRAE